MKINHIFTETKRTQRPQALLFGLAMLCALLLLLALQSATKPAHAATTFVVNTTSDFDDHDFPNGTFDGSSDGECDANPPFAGGTQCTLRAAIQQANVTKGADTIHFDIPTTSSPNCVSATGVCTITPGSRGELPTITKPVTIDGYTQSGATENTEPQPGKTNAVLMIELDGNASGIHTGLAIGGKKASKSVIRGLVINGFLGSGISLNGGKGHKIEGNFIGTDPGGTLDEGNGTGVFLNNADNSTIGGTSPEARNLISGNNGDSVFAVHGSSGNKIQGNLIGPNKDGTNTPNNLGSFVGVSLAAGSSNNTVGDSDPSDGPTNAANTIAFNNNGVWIFDSLDCNNPGGSSSIGNRILSNSIFSNGALGIDLLEAGCAFGVTANDPNDPTTPNPDPDKDTGPNNLQNYPVITSAQMFDDPFFGDTTVIEGNLNSTPSTRKKKRTFIIQFFSSPEADSSGYGEGKTFLDQIEVKTDKQGNASFDFSTEAVLEGEYITATATNKKTGDTSEFSEARVVVEPPPPVIGGG